MCIRDRPGPRRPPGRLPGEPATSEGADAQSQREGLREVIGDLDPELFVHAGVALEEQPNRYQHQQRDYASRAQRHPRPPSSGYSVEVEDQPRAGDFEGYDGRGGRRPR